MYFEQINLKSRPVLFVVYIRKCEPVAMPIFEPGCWRLELGRSLVFKIRNCSQMYCVFSEMLEAFYRFTTVLQCFVAMEFLVISCIL